MPDKKLIVVLGATGVQGGGLCRAILADTQGEFTCRAITRDPGKDKAKALAAQGAQVVKADLDDPASLKQAFAGAHGIYAVTNFWEHLSGEKEKTQSRNISEAARHANPRHLIWSTLEDTRKLMRPDDKRMPFLQEKYRVPHFDAKSEADAFFNGLPTTFLLTSFYWDNLYMFGMAPKKGPDGQYAWTFPMGKSRLAGMAGEDIGKVALGIFKGGAQHIGKRIGVLSEALTIEQMGQTLSKVLHCGPIHYNAVDANTYRGFGFPGADEMGNMFQVYDEFETQVLGARSGEVARQLAPSLKTFEQFVAANKAAIQAAMA